MFSIETLFLFIFNFSILILLRAIFRFISALLQNPPQRLVLSSRELLIIGFSVSYILTYLIQL